MTLIAGLDLETTGFKAEKGDRIIEVALGVYDLETRQRKLSFVQRVNPLRSIPADATAVHGITIEDLRHEPTWDAVASKVEIILARCQWVIAHNLDFDAPFLLHEMTNVGKSIPKTLNGFCTMENARWATADGKLPKLGELCWALNIPYDTDKAHAAEYDVDCMMQCLWAGMDLGFYNLEIKH